MTNEDMVFPLAGGIECSGVRVAGGNAILRGAQPRERRSNRNGWDCSPGQRPRSIIDRRIEQWIASNLDLDTEVNHGPRSAWLRIIDGPVGPRSGRASPKQRRDHGGESRQDGWARFQVAYKRGITVVRLVDKTLVRENQIHELACDLLDLIAAGNHRVVLNFQVVERLASWVVVAVEEARRRCEAADGGALKICGLPQQLAAVFPIAGVPLRLTLHPDEGSAVDGPWPEPSGPRPLPIEILTALTRAADLPPLVGERRYADGLTTRPISGPARRSIVRRGRGLEAVYSHFHTIILHAGRWSFVRPEAGVWLNVQVGSAKARTVEVSGPQAGDRPRPGVSPASRLGDGQQAPRRHRTPRQQGVCL